MKILFSSLSAHGHTYPLLPLARAAAAAGHAVTFATGREFQPLLARLGHDAVEVGPDKDAAFRQAAAEVDDPADAVDRYFTGVLPRAYAADLGPVLDRVKPDLVVYGDINTGAAIAAKARGIPVVGHALGRGQLSLMFPSLPGALRALAAEHGVDLSADPVLSGDPHLDIYPASLQDPAEMFPVRSPLRPVAFAEPGDLPDWLRDEPLAYLTLGTAFGDPAVLRTAIDGLARLPLRVLVAAGPAVDAEELRDVPASVTVLPWVPQARLLPHADLVVHHGGSGTTLGALALALPQLVLPQGADQFRNADALTSAGIARTLVGAELTADAVAGAAGALLSDPGAGAAASAVAAEIAAMPSPEEVVGSLAAIAR